MIPKHPKVSKINILKKSQGSVSQPYQGKQMRAIYYTSKKQNYETELYFYRSLIIEMTVSFLVIKI